MRTLCVGLGFLGAYFANQYLRNQLNQLIVADPRPKSDMYNHPLLISQLKGLRENQLTYYQVNSGDPLKLADEFAKGIDNIVYTAAIANVGFAIANPILTFDTNDAQLLRFLEFLRAVDYQGRFVLMSSESVLGHQPEDRLHLDIREVINKDTGEPTGETTSIARGFREDECVPKPANIYGATKLMQENLALSYHSMYGIRVTVLRSSTMIGQYMRMDQAIPQWIKEVLVNNTLTREGDGSQTRDIIHVKNVANAIMKTINLPDDRADGEILHVGSGRELIFDNLARQIIKLADSDARIISKGWRAGEKGLRVVLDVSKAVKMIGHDPDYDLNNAIADLYLWVANYDPELLWPVEQIEALQVRLMRLRPSETRAYAKYVREHGKEPESYKELEGLAGGIGPSAKGWKATGEDTSKGASGQSREPESASSRFDNMRVAGFGGEAEQDEKIQETLAQYGLDPGKILAKAPEKAEILTMKKDDEDEDKKYENVTPPPREPTATRIDVDVEAEEDHKQKVAEPTTKKRVIERKKKGAE